jgi:hypothetical protein
MERVSKGPVHVGDMDDYADAALWSWFINGLRDEINLFRKNWMRTMLERGHGIVEWPVQACWELTQEKLSPRFAEICDISIAECRALLDICPPPGKSKAFLIRQWSVGRGLFDTGNFGQVASLSLPDAGSSCRRAVGLQGDPLSLAMKDVRFTWRTKVTPWTVDYQRLIQSD